MSRIILGLLVVILLLSGSFFYYYKLKSAQMSALVQQNVILETTVKTNEKVIEQMKEDAAKQSEQNNILNQSMIDIEKGYNESNSAIDMMDLTLGLINEENSIEKEKILENKINEEIKKSLQGLRDITNFMPSPDSNGL